MAATLLRARIRVLETPLTIAVLVLAWVAAIVVVDPRAEVPLIDDWVYAASVEALLAGKGLVVSSWSSTFPAVQVAWGALVAALAGGFSLTALRVSTLVLALVGTLAFAGLLRTLGCRPVHVLLGALVWMVYPVAFVLSFTFMTDVPFAALALASLWAMVRGLATGRIGLVELGLALAVADFLVRPLALAIPAGLLCTALCHRGLPGRRRVAAFALAALLAMLGASLIGMRLWPYAGAGGVAYRTSQIRYVLAVSPLVYAEAALSMLAHVGLAVSPALLATAPPPRRWPWRTIAALLVLAATLSIVAPAPVAALKARATWSTQELGAARPLLQGWTAPTPVRAALAAAATVVGLVAGACLLARVAGGLRAGGILRSPAAACVVAFGAAMVALGFVLWLFYDRYYLPVVPVALAVALLPEGASGREQAGDGDGGRGSWRRVRVSAAALAIGALALLDVTGTRDMLAFARAVSAAAERLHARGVPYHRMDAGYAENGWRLYAHPDHLPEGATQADVPHVTSASHTPFVVAVSPVEGYDVLASLPVPTWWAQGDHVYALAEE